ncbi:MAG TPA: Hsp70 family protein [Mycobacteriales bacterium]|nr:Hsp70 family protein [Mycobacteriales bacterium]
MRILAVDFGTSNTVAALGVDGVAPRLVSIDGSPLLPSSVFLADDGGLVVGRDADRQARLDPSRYEPNPKRRIDDGVILLGASALPVATVIAEVFRRVAGEVRRQLGGRGPGSGEIDQVRLTHPARWGQRRTNILVVAARTAGIGDPVLIPEPVAAATHFATLAASHGIGGLRDGQALAVYDLGGGTVDVAVVARHGAGDVATYEVLAEAGLPDLGGLDVDHAILEHIGATHAGTIDPEAWRRLLHPTDAATRRQARVLATDVREGKEALSRYPHVDIALPPPFPDVHLTRAELEELIRPTLDRSVDLLARTVADAGTTAARLAGVYLVGGSSRIPLVARMVQERLGVTPTTLDQPETSVVTGALYLPLGGAQRRVPPVWPRHLTGPAPAYPRSRVPLPVPPLAAPLPVAPLLPVPPRVYATVPRAQVRPLPAGPGGPPSRVRRRVGQRVGRRVAFGAGVLVAALLAVLSVVVAHRRGDGAGPGTSPTASGSMPPTGLVQYFDDTGVLRYVRPTFTEITSCRKGFGAGVTSTAVPGSTTCTYANGVVASFAKAGSVSNINIYRDTLAELLPSVVKVIASKGRWSHGHLDTYAGTDVAGLYWDDDQNAIFGFALAPVSSLRVDGLEAWWRGRFG